MYFHLHIGVSSNHDLNRDITSVILALLLSALLPLMSAHNNICTILHPGIVLNITYDKMKIETSQTAAGSVVRRNL